MAPIISCRSPKTIARNQNIDYICFHNEQSAAMAADAVWRVTRKPGVTVVTSGPGATNLITGIACSYFDSIPSIHITGQVNKSESIRGVNARQIGFQETDIVSVVKPLTKYAKLVTDPKTIKYREVDKTGDNKDCVKVLLKRSISCKYIDLMPCQFTIRSFH